MPNKTVWAAVLVCVAVLACGPGKSFKSDEDFQRGLAFADSAAGEPIDLLEDEVLPNEEIAVPEKEEPALNLTPDEPPYAAFRVQVISAVNPANSKKAYDELKPEYGDEVYLVKEDSLWKVRVGSFDVREAAEVVRAKMIAKGFEGAWIVAAEKIETITPVVPKDVYGYRIQVGAFSDKIKAETLRDELQTNINEPIYVEPIDNLWKIHVGNCASRDDADGLKELLKSLGYNGFVIKSRIETNE